VSLCPRVSVQVGVCVCMCVTRATRVTVGVCVGACVHVGVCRYVFSCACIIRVSYV